MQSIPAAFPPEPRELELRDYLAILLRRKTIFIQVFLVVLAVGLATTAATTPIYRAEARLQVPTPSFSLNILDSSNPIGGILAASQPDQVETQIQILESEPFQEEARARAGLRVRAGVIPPGVTISAVKDTSVIEVRSEGGDPKEVADLANAVVDLHQEKSRARDQEGLDRAIRFLKQRKKEADAELQAAQRQLMEFRRKYRLGEKAAAQDAQGKEFAALQSRARAARYNLETAREGVERLKRDLAALPANVTQRQMRENPRVPVLQARLDELTTQRVELGRQFAPTSDRMRSFDSEIAAATERLAAEPRAIGVDAIVPNPERAALESRLRDRELDLRDREAEYHVARAEAETAVRPVDVTGALDLEQQRLTQLRDGALTVSTDIAERLRDVEMRKIASVDTFRVIQHAAPPVRPVESRHGNTLPMSAALAVVLGIMLAFLQEYLDDRVHLPSDLSRATELPLLAHVPRIPGDADRLVSANHPNSVVAEAYRTLRSSIGFAAIDAPIRRLLVTSSVKGEGKSVTSVNLAAVMALDGKRVILVDADMRNPSVHRLLGQPKNPGLSELLSGEISIPEALQETSLPNLRVVTAGTQPVNPAELLASARFDSVLEQLDAEADMIILDSPPCLPVSDPLTIAPRTQGVVLIVRFGETRRGAIRQSEELLLRTRAPLLGVVLNQVVYDRSNYYYYGSYYGEDAVVRGRERAEV